MQVKIFTLPFDEKTESFEDELVTVFCQNKKIHRLKTHFFRQEGKAFWSIAVQYESVVTKQQEKIRDLDESQELLFQRLREWRKETGNKEGIPVYIIATNIQLVSMIKIPCKTLDSFKLVKGFGVKRVGKYGRQIIALIKGFYEEQKDGDSTALLGQINSPDPPFVTD